MSIEKENLLAFGDSQSESPQRENILALDSFIPYVETQLKDKESLTLDFLHWAIKDSECELLFPFLSVTEMTEEIIKLLDEDPPPLKSAEKWICLFKLGKYSKEINEMLVKRGYLKIIKKSDFHLENVMDLAISYSQMEIVKYFFPLQKDTYVFDIDWAANYGYLEAIKYFHGSGVKEKCSYLAMNWAARDGHLEVVKWLNAVRKEGCTKWAMNFAAQYGHLEIVKFLHFNRKEGCTQYAMDYAAKNGHLEVVKFLHFNRTEGCTSFAMNCAAGKGHLEVVRFLHAVRPEGCTYHAKDWAAENGHLEVVKFLKSLKTP